MRRYELSDAEWKILENLMPPPFGRPPTLEHRRFLNAVMWKVRSGSPWRDMPDRYGAWETVYGKFRRWAKAGQCGHQ